MSFDGPCHRAQADIERGIRIDSNSHCIIQNVSTAVTDTPRIRTGRHAFHQNVVFAGSHIGQGKCSITSSENFDPLLNLSTSPNETYFYSREICSCEIRPDCPFDGNAPVHGDCRSQRNAELFNIAISHVNRHQRRGRVSAVCEHQIRSGRNTRHLEGSISTRTDEIARVFQNQIRAFRNECDLDVGRQRHGRHNLPSYREPRRVTENDVQTAGIEARSNAYNLCF